MLLLCRGAYQFSYLGVMCNHIFIYVTSRVSCWTLCFHPLQRQLVDVALTVGGHSLEVPGDLEK